MKKILLVEDDPFLVDIYTTKFKEAGFEVDVATDGEMALAKTKEASIDLVILDIVLPQMDGWEILKEIKEIKKFLPVIILSNLSQPAEVEKGLQLGAIKYLIKAHYTPSEVVEEIKKVLK
ncbi:MAG: response regulator [Candidatus Nealsonbacteria bacterium]|nr:response regulator [Candidatus Nealsonbacteria bacterium]